jgi:3-oxoacyl-[acyl-carrier-protein] synthase-1
MMKYRVAITGLGIISCLGTNFDEVAESLYKGKSGIVADYKRKRLGFSSCLSGAIAPYTPRFPLSRKQCKTMPDFAQWAVVACSLAATQVLWHQLSNPQLCWRKMTQLLWATAWCFVQ